MPLVDFGWKSYAGICLFVSYFYKCSTREWVTEAMTEMSLNQSGAEESSVVKHSLERNLESMEKKKSVFHSGSFAIFLKLMSCFGAAVFDV